MPRRSVDIKVVAAVPKVDATVAGKDFTMKERRSGEWRGRGRVEIPDKESAITIEFVAPSFTKWSIKVKLDNETLYEGSGKTEEAGFELDIPVGEEKDSGDEKEHEKEDNPEIVADKGEL